MGGHDSRDGQSPKAMTFGAEPSSLCSASSLWKGKVLMPKIAIITDSTAGLPRSLVEQYDIHVVPQQLHWGEETFLDGVTIDAPTFHERLGRSAEIPTTSGVSVRDFVAVLSELAGGNDGVVGVFMSSKMSGTVTSALAAREYMSALPFEPVDSRSTSMGLGFVALAAAHAAAEGKGLMQVAAVARELVPRVSVLFMVETLKYLHLGGRIGGAARLPVSPLRMIPLLTFDDGRVEALGQVRTKHRAVRRILEVMAERVEKAPVHAAVFHANAYEEAVVLEERVRERFPCVELHLAELSPVLATHVGPGTVGVAFYPELEPGRFARGRALLQRLLGNR